MNNTSEALRKRVKALEEEVERLRNEKNDTGRSPAKVELQPKTRDREARRDSWADIYNETTALHKSGRLLGQEVEIDDGLEWRVKWGQRGAAIFGLLLLICWTARQAIAFVVFGALALISTGIVYYKNVSFIIAKRLLRETNVVVILVLVLCNLSIDIARPYSSFSPINGMIYMVAVSLGAFLDAIKVKSRIFVMSIGTLFILLNMNNIYHYTFGDSDHGVVLLKYSVQENDYTIMKRSTKLSIFIQIVFFSMNGLYTLFKDRKQELMIFATGNIYRETGTASKATIL